MYCVRKLLLYFRMKECCIKNPMRWEMIRLVIGFLMESQTSVTVSQRLSVERVKYNIVDALQRGDTIMQTQRLFVFDIRIRLLPKHVQDIQEWSTGDASVKQGVPVWGEVFWKGCLQHAFIWFRTKNYKVVIKYVWMYILNVCTVAL